MASPTTTSPILVPQKGPRGTCNSVLDEQVALPPFTAEENAFQYEATLVTAGFSFVKWEVGVVDGPVPDRSLTKYRVQNTIPDPNTQMDPSGIVQVIIFLPPHDGEKD